MIEAVVLKFEGVVARPAPSLANYIESLVRDRDFNFAESIIGFYASRQPFESYYADVLVRAGVSDDEALDVMARVIRALSLVEGWRLYDDVPVALDWLHTRRIPVAIVHDWPVTPSELLAYMGQKGGSIDVIRIGALSDAFWEITSRVGASVEQLLYVAATQADYEDSRSLGCRPLIMDRAGRFDETVPNINHLVELELHI